MKRLKILNIICSVLILLLSLCGSAFALKAGPVTFTEYFEQDGYTLRLQGAGLKKFLTFKVVAVGLYIDAQASGKDPLSDTAKRLEVNYLLNIPKAELDRATIEGIRKNVDNREYERLRNRISQVNSYFPDVKNGDMIALTYIPGKGTIVEVDGQVKGVVRGEDFARAFFSIWIGENPVDAVIKNKLLKQGKP